MKPSYSRICCPGVLSPRAFTLVELLVVMAVVALLCALLLPALARSREKAKVVRVRVELNNISTALDLYWDDFHGRLPPVRVNCNSDQASYWCEFPPELAALQYLPPAGQSNMAVNAEDLFNRGHTYKYAAPGPELVNGQPLGKYGLWVPEDVPNCASTNGQSYSTLAESPVRWVIWSLGPQPDSPRTQTTHSPMVSWSWYRRTGEGGVIARFACRDGLLVNTP